MDSLNIEKLAEFARRQHHVVGRMAQACHHHGHRTEGMTLNNEAEGWVTTAKRGEHIVDARDRRAEERRA